MTSIGGHEHEIRRNRNVSRVLIGTNLALLGVTGAVLTGALGDRAAIVTAAVFMLGGFGLSLCAPMALGAVAGAHPADDRAPQASELLAGLAIRTGIPTPRLCIIDDPVPNTFAYGRHPRSSNIAVTTGLLAVMSRRELEGVLAHEVAHIVNRDTRAMTVAFGTYGMFVLVLSVLLGIGGWAGSSAGDTDDPLSIGIGVAVFLAALVTLPAAIGSWLMTMAISHDREALADASAVQFMGTPSGLRRALEKLETIQAPDSGRSAAIVQLSIHNPAKHRALGDTHPPIAWRIGVLRQLEGLDPHQRDPVDAWTAPGWYEDPNDPHAWRWWDGQQWTDHTAPRTPAAPGSTR